MKYLPISRPLPSLMPSSPQFFDNLPVDDGQPRAFFDTKRVLEDSPGRLALGGHERNNIPLTFEKD